MLSCPPPSEPADSDSALRDGYSGVKCDCGSFRVQRYMDGVFVIDSKHSDSGRKAAGYLRCYKCGNIFE